MSAVRVGLLGPVTCVVDGERRRIGGAKQRAMLATLALSAGRVVPVAVIVEAVWSDDPPPGAEHSLQQHVSTLRKALRSDDPSAAPVLVTQAPGYRLDIAAVDVEEFETWAAAGRAAAASGDRRTAAEAFGQALAVWRGDALVDAQGSARLQAAATRLDEQRLVVVEAALDVRLDLGDHQAAAVELEDLVGQHPLRERLRALQMLALYRCGRQADALSAFQLARAALADGLGIEPGPALRDLEHAILEQRPALDAPATLGDADVYATHRADEAATARVVLPDGQAVVLPPGTSFVGRDPTATVRLVDSRVSRRHAEIATGGGRTTVRDLGSTNGTTVNDSAVEQVDLRDGDVIGIGGVRLEFRTG